MTTREYHEQMEYYQEEVNRLMSQHHTGEISKNEYQQQIQNMRKSMEEVELSYKQQSQPPILQRVARFLSAMSSFWGIVEWVLRASIFIGFVIWHLTGNILWFIGGAIVSAAVHYIYEQL